MNLSKKWCLHTKSPNKEINEMSDKHVEQFDVQGIDAVKWAKEFVRLNTASDEATMRAWFASAIMAGYDEAKRRNGASVEALSTQINPQDDGVLDNTNEQSDSKRVTTVSMSEKDFQEFVYGVDEEAVKKTRELFKRSQCSKTERCELDVGEVENILWEIEDHGQAAKAICSHFTAPNVKDDRDKLIIAMKEEILILRANIEDLKAEKHNRCELDEKELHRMWFTMNKEMPPIVGGFIKAVCKTFTAPNVKRLSVNDIKDVIDHTYCVSCDIFTAKGKLVNSESIAKLLHQRIYGHKRSLL